MYMALRILIWVGRVIKFKDLKINYRPVFTGISQNSSKNDTLFLNFLYLHLLHIIKRTLLELDTVCVDVESCFG